MKRTYLNPDGVPNWSSLFSQAVSIQAGDSTTVYVSGQVGVTEDQVLWGDGSLSAQAQRALHNLSLVLADAGCSIEHVTKLSVYVTGYKPEHAAIVGSAIRAHFPEGRLPALSLLGVQALARPEFAVEIEAIAVMSTSKV